MTRFGCYLPVHSEQTPPVGPVVAVARAAEQAGLDHVWAADHLTWNRDMLAPVPTLALVAASTSRVGLGIGVYLLPLRHPAFAAKDLATLDHLADGRLQVGVGIGGEDPDEYRGAGVPPTAPGRRLDDALAVVTALWAGDPAPDTPTFGALPPTPIGPRPVGHIPVWVGGRSTAAVDRAARGGHGWFAMWVSPDRVARERSRALTGHRIALNVFTRVADDVATADRALAERTASAYRMDFGPVRQYALSGPPDRIADRIAAYVEAGVTDLVFNIAGDDVEDQLGLIVTEVLPALSAPSASPA